MHNKNKNYTIAEAYSSWAYDLKIEDIPKTVIEKLNIIVMDSIGLMISAKNEDYIKSLLDALNEMQNSEKASGYEQFMESMQSISNQQQNINQGTMQLGQFSLMQQQNLMEQLQSQQQKLKLTKHK